MDTDTSNCNDSQCDLKSKLVERGLTHCRLSDTNIGLCLLLNWNLAQYLPTNTTEERKKIKTKHELRHSRQHPKVKHCCRCLSGNGGGPLPPAALEGHLGWLTHLRCLVASPVCALIWPAYHRRYVHSSGSGRMQQQQWKKKKMLSSSAHWKAGRRALPGMIYDAAEHLMWWFPVMLMLLPGLVRSSQSHLPPSSHAGPPLMPR